MCSSVRMEVFDQYITANDFFVEKFHSCFCGNVWYSFSLGPTSKIVDGGYNVAVPFFGHRERSNEIDAYSFPWCNRSEGESWFGVIWSALHLASVTCSDIIFYVLPHVRPEEISF